MGTTSWRRVCLLIVLTIAVAWLGNHGEAAAAQNQNEKGKRCSDGIDNDGDGLVDADDPDCGGDDGGSGGGGPANVFSLEIRQTTNLWGDQPEAGDPALTLYLDHAQPGGSTCVTGQRQNVRGKSFGGRVDLDRGSDEPGAPDFDDCNWVNGLPDQERRTFTMVIDDACACGVLGFGAVASCEVTPDVFAAVTGPDQPDDADPRVSAAKLAGNKDDATALFIRWRASNGDGTFTEYVLQPERSGGSSSHPFATTQDGDARRFRFQSDPDPGRRVDFNFIDPGNSCPAPFRFEIDLTFVFE